MAPGTFPIEGDLAESWTQPNDTTYVFKLRRGVRWHNKPPVNGRELTADDVVYTVERFLHRQGQRQRLHAARSLEQGRGAVDKYTVQVHAEGALRVVPRHPGQPASRSAIVAKECVEKFGDLKKPEAVVGTGPWMLDSYRPERRHDVRAQPRATSSPGLPLHRPGRGRRRRGQRLAHGRRSSPASTTSGWEFPGTINRTDWVQIKDTLKQRRPNLQTMEYPANVM